MRFMLTAFMSDATNIMSFYKEDDRAASVGHSAELWIFKPQSGTQVIVIWNIISVLSNYMQLAMMVIRTGNALSDMDENISNNLMEIKGTILPFEWHSFCISIDPSMGTVKLYHDGHIQADVDLSIEQESNNKLFKFLEKGQIGGQKFVGFITDLNMFGTVLPEAELMEWTSCKIKVRFAHVS
jgi:hypothetical protein